MGRGGDPPGIPGPDGLSRRDRCALAGGPLPRPTGDGLHRTHYGCGGAGCDTCRGTGYETMHPAAIAALEARIAALAAGERDPEALERAGFEGRAAYLAGRGGSRPGGQPGAASPRPDAPGRPARDDRPAVQAAFGWD